MSESAYPPNWSVFSKQDIEKLQRAAYENGFKEAQRLLLADLDKLRDPVTLHPGYQWLRDHFETLVTTAKLPKEPYSAK
jgi:hypothetical protein